MTDIKLFVMDVDGTLTDGKIFIGANGEIMKAFNVKDGYGIAQILPKYGISPVIITGRNSEIVAKRAEELGIKMIYQGISNKLEQLKKIADELGIGSENIAYIGDDLNDIECIEYCGFTACPADAIPDVLREVDFICAANGGDGAVREFIDHLTEMF